MVFHKIQYSKARFSKNKCHRYFLERCWNKKKPALMIIGLNPSTADAINNDPTVARCINFGKTWGYGRIYMMNIFAYRATNPIIMKAAKNPIGKENDKWLVRVAARSDMILAAWGNHGFYLDRDIQIITLLKKYKLFCLDKNVTGCPKHPLYCKQSLKPKPYLFF